MSKKKKNKSQEVKEQKISNDDYLKGHLVRENDREWVVLKPSYWLFNAGLVGIIRTIEEGKNYKEPENSEENQGYEKSIHLKKINQILCEISDGNIDNYKFYKFSKNGALLIKKEVWDRLPEMYDIVMKLITNSDTWWINLNKKWMINRFPNKKSINILNYVEKDLKNIKGNLICSICGSFQGNIRTDFKSSTFNLEGGGYSSSAFKNFYYGENTQLPLCNLCSFVLLFYPIAMCPFMIKGLYKASTFEFINILHAEYLWLLNKYRMDLEKTLEEKRSFEGVRSRLVDAVTSTSAILRLKSRWLLQNVEFIEIGGIREKSVHVLEIHPVALELLYDFLDYRIQEWVSKVEKLNKTINELTLKGRKLIGFFLNGEAGMLIKTVLPFIKMEFSSENKKNKKDFYFWEQMRASINVSLSLLEGMPAREDFYYLGKNLKGLLYDNDKVKNLCSKLLPLIITGRKEKFVEELLRTYMTLGVEVPDKVVEFLCAESTQNHISSKGDLLFKCRALQFFIGLWNGKGGFYE